MRLKLFYLIILLLLVLLMSACGQGVEETIYDDSGEVAAGDAGESRYGNYEDDKMIGTSGPPDKEKKILGVNISEWEKRNDGPVTTDEGIGYDAHYDEETIVRNEDGTEASLDDIKVGQKVQVNPPRGDSFEGYAEEIIVLDMTFEEKYDQLLAHSDGIRIVVMYEYGERTPDEMQEPLFEEANNILEETGMQVNASWHEYDKDFLVDFKEELKIEQFPVILVFDREDLLAKAYEVEEIYEFLRGMAQ